MVVGENKRSTNIMDGIENTGDVRLHDHRLRLKQRFDIVRKLGQGTYGKVQLGINKKTGQEVAIKTIKKCKIETEADLVRIRREVQIMSSVRHPNIVHIYEVFENSEKMILVMEYCSGGELYDYLSQKKVLEEEEARRLFRQIATAVYYCHIHKICHRDLKLENVLLDDTGSAKIADFGLSNVFKETSLLSTFCGSPLYASPEIVKGTPYIGPEVDCWSLGVLLYTLVYGAMPFDGSNFKRLVRQISNGDYYEPKNPSTASPLIRDMLTVDPLKRADIAYICDHPWVNGGCETSCLEVAEALAAETPVRLDLLLSLAPAAPSHSNSVLVPDQNELGPEESCTDLTSSASMPVEPSNSAEKRILELVAEGGEDAIKPSPTRTLVAAGDYKRKLDAAVSNSGLVRKKERVASSASVPPLSPALPEEDAKLDSPPADEYQETEAPLTLKSSATITIAPTPEPAAEPPKEPEPKVEPKEEKPKETPKPKLVIRKKTSPTKSEEKSPEKLESPKIDESKTNSVSSTAEKLTSLSLAQPAATTPTKPKKLSIGGHVGSFKEQFERRASLTTSPEIKRNISKPVVSKIAKPKAQSEDRELRARSPEYGAVRLQQIGIEPSQTPPEENNRRMDGGVKKTESEPSNSSTTVDPSVLLQDARRSLQNSMAKLVEERAGEDSRRRAARDIISSAIRTGKPPVPYGRSSSAGVATASLQSPPPATPPAAPAPAPRVFRTEAHHKVEDHRNRGVSVERIIPIHLAGEEPNTPKTTPTSPPKFTPAATPPPPPAAAAAAAAARQSQTPIRRLTSNDSSAGDASPGEPIKKSAREFIIPIAVEGKGYVTPRQRSLEPEHAPHSPLATSRLARKPRRISSLVSGGESEEEEESPMHRLRSARSRPARADSVSSGEDDEEDEGFHLLTAENLFSTLLHRVRALTNRLNGEEGPGFQHPHSLFNNLQSPFFNSAHLPRRNLLREGWGSRDMGAPFDSMFKSRQQMPRGSIKRSGKHQPREPPTDEASTGLDLSDLDLNSIEFSEREMAALSGLTPALSRRLQQQLLAHLPPRAARRLRRTLSLHADQPPAAPAAPAAPASSSAGETDSPANDLTDDQPAPERSRSEETSNVSTSQFFTLPRLKRRTAPVQCVTPTPTEDIVSEISPETQTRKLVRELSSEPKEPDVRGGSVRNTPDRPLLSKYLTPERNISLDDYSSDGGSILSEPSYIMAYGSPLKNSNPSFRRHSLRLSVDQPRKRISRFLRPDFFDPPAEENFVAKHKKEKELETQKILKEIREKKNRVLESESLSPEIKNENTFRDDYPPVRKCLSPISSIVNRERSRSTTPYFPILDNIKETNLDNSYIGTKKSVSLDRNDSLIPSKNDNVQSKETKLTRPKSYPVKNFETFEDTKDASVEYGASTIEKEVDENKVAPKESRLIRPKSYPTSNPSSEKMTLCRSVKNDEVKSDEFKNSMYTNGTERQVTSSADKKPDVEVNFSITLPKRKPKTSSTEISNKIEKSSNQNSSLLLEHDKDTNSTLSIKRYQVVNGTNSSPVDVKCENTVDHDVVKNKESQPLSADQKTNDPAVVKNEILKSNTTNLETNDKKATVKKKIIKKVTARSKTDLDTNPSSNETIATEKKKATKKIKEKATEDSCKSSSATKKKSVLQSIGHKLERFATSKSNSPDKLIQESVDTTESKKVTKLNRTQRENSVPVNTDPPTESNLIKRAVTITDVAALDSPATNNNQNKTAVSKVLGLFKKFEPKEKNLKISLEKLQNETSEAATKVSNVGDLNIENGKDKLVKRPTSLLLNGLGRKNRLNKNTNNDASESTGKEPEDSIKDTKDEIKNVRNSLKLDFSRLPRVKKIVPTNPVIEPLIMNVSDSDKDCSLNDSYKTKVSNLENSTIDVPDSLSRSRSRSRSTFSNSDIKSEGNAADLRDKYYSPDSSLYHLPVRNRESLTPEKEDLAERIRRKSFYSRFNERKQRRKSNLVGPGATEYDPLARIHSAGSDHKYDISPTSPNTYDLSPGFSVASDASPSTDRYKSLFGDVSSTKANSRYDGLNDKIDTYRSLDRNEFRKYPGSRSYYDYDQTSTYIPHRYSRTKSLFDSCESEDQGSLLREPHKYNRTNSLYTPGNYATYRPKRTRNSAIILKESEKEPSPENILDKIRQRKISISVTRKLDPEKETLQRSPGPPKGEGDSSERVEKVD